MGFKKRTTASLYQIKTKARNKQYATKSHNTRNTHESPRLISTHITYIYHPMETRLPRPPIVLDLNKFSTKPSMME